MKKSNLLIGMGVLNLLHGLFHVLHFLQSVLLATHKYHSDESFLDSPILSFVWVLLGGFSLYIGIKDFKHHKKCNNESTKH